jgi:hypothetical protein
MGDGGRWRSPSAPCGSGRRDCRPPPSAISATDLQFFETRIRPVLIDRCYKCHSRDADKIKGGLMLDTREGMLHGGDTGPAVSPGKPEDSLIIDAISYKDADLQMPPKGDKLSDQQVADITDWIRRGAFDPRSLVSKGSSSGLRRRGPRALVVPAGQERTTATAGRGRAVVPDPGRQLHPRPHGGERGEAQPAGRQVHADPPGDLRPDGPSPDGGGGAALPRRRLARSLGQGGRPPARLAPLRRALGPLLAGRRPLRRHEGRHAPTARTRATRSPGPTGTT